jgi:hypothetical protein
MSTGNPEDWGRKGSAIAKFLIALLLFFVLLIWVYNKNQHGLD